MAPLKRSNPIAQRETRTTRAATVAKKRATTSDKKSDALSAGITATTQSKPTISTRKGRKAADTLSAEQETSQIDEAEQPIRVEVEVAKSTRSGAVRGKISTAGLTAAPRRRVKITPLNTSISDSTAIPDAAKDSKSRSISKDAPSKKKATRSKDGTNISVDDTMEEAPVVETRVKTTRRTTTKPADDKEVSKQSKVKTRGRPKARKLEETTLIPIQNPDTIITTRATRSHRVGSVSLEAASQPTAIQSLKPSNVVRKTVTFQDIPDEDDKENQPLPQSKAKRETTKKLTESAEATGMRARPLRKAVTTTASTRGRKATVNPAEKSKKPSSTGDPKAQEKKMPRALTPKKITQVAKSSSPRCEEKEVSEEEDELNGAKTPIRDLSLSPKRPLSAALARALSPAKKLDFGQSLVARSPDRTAIFHNPEADQIGMLASPARRPASSPFKDGMKESPKRGLNDGSKLLFANHQEPASMVFNAFTNNASAQAKPVMLQSPKRAGVLDSNFFSQSAMKKSVSKSPFKSSLFGTPAKRLFSPAKKDITPAIQRAVEPEMTIQRESEAEEMELESEVTASSHFRSSASPLRVMRVEPDTVDVDFDDSVLQVRSPLKSQKSPINMPFQIEHDINVESESATCPTEAATASEIVDVVEPFTLNIFQERFIDVVDQMERQERELVVDQTAQPVIDFPMSDEAVKQKEPVSISRPEFVQRPSLSQILFRSANTTGEEESSSEDELAGDQTPVNSQNRTAGTRDRLSTGFSRSAFGKSFGFTPLAAQMSGWLATSPEKSPEQHQNTSSKDVNLDFSPLARQHIDGEIIISRDSTPVQKLSKRLSVQPISSSKTVTANRKSLNLRKSLAQRQSIGLLSSTESPIRNPQFEEYMEIRALEKQAAAAASDNSDIEIDTNNNDFNHMMNFDHYATEVEDPDATILDIENESSEDQFGETAGDLTTDLINFTHASDTAMVDFHKLAEEADELASDETSHDDPEAEPARNLQDSPGQTEPVYDNIELPETHHIHEEHASSVERDTEATVISPEDVVLPPGSPLLQPIREQLESPSMCVIDEDNSSNSGPSSPVYSAAHSPALSVMLNTPKPAAITSGQRVVNTVVSKVPLRPEGSISPIKMLRKRSRSFSNSDTSPAKRISFEDLKSLSLSNPADSMQSPERRVRTSAAPSPGGTSTPAAYRSSMTPASRSSVGNVSVATTPGQMSFAIDDFGDSTLDGIELPEDFEDATEFEDGNGSPARSIMSSTRTPRARLLATPSTAQRSVRGATTPATITKKTPKTARKTPAQVCTNKSTERTPLGPVGKGFLHGATVFVDVHTSEGADASGIFIELLTQMGAKCVKEWRWNPRASLALNAENELAEQKIGVSHVVFKDGGKRTLEKVRDSKGEVCCVGVAWVLDCERENKWLDESKYQIDTSILPRGGSKRRKSMEPRALLVGNDGSISASRSRRSVSAEMSELMKRALLNTPARGPTTSMTLDDDLNDENDENVEQSTPTGFVSYDPRTAMTPGTPYLVSQGKNLIQMSAPPKQLNKSLFDDEDEENNDSLMENENGNTGGVKDAKKFRMKNLGDLAKRRRTFGWKPAVGSPLGRI